MEKELTLVIMAAGIGSRFGERIKQLEPVGPNGELIIDYSIFDAVRAGFNHIVFIIRKDIEQLFREAIGNRIEKQVKVTYVFQEKSDMLIVMYHTAILVLLGNLCKGKSWKNTTVIKDVICVREDAGHSAAKRKKEPVMSQIALKSQGRHSIFGKSLVFPERKVPVLSFSAGVRWAAYFVRTKKSHRERPERKSAMSGLQKSFWNFGKKVPTISIL